MPDHRVAIRDALIALLESPVHDDNSVGMTILTRVIFPRASLIDLGKPVFNFRDTEHLSPLVKPGPTPVV